MSTDRSHGLNRTITRLIALRDRVVRMLTQHEERRNAIVTRAETERRKRLTTREAAEFHEITATITDLQEAVIAIDEELADLTTELRELAGASTQ